MPMRWPRLTERREGVTLVELMVGTAVAGLILTSVASIEIASWKYRRADEQAFAGQAEATTLLDRLAQDVRQATGVAVTGDGASVLTLTVAGTPVTYQYDGQARQALRQGRALAEAVAGLQFYREDGGRTVRAVVTMDGGYRLESRATTRLGQ
jgi:Tfp pilus assembly protein PilW